MERAHLGRGRRCGGGVRARRPAKAADETVARRFVCSPSHAPTAARKSEPYEDADREAVPPANEFICTGQLCSISYNGDRFTLRFRKGLHLLGILLREPGRAFHVCELFAVVHPIDPAMICLTGAPGSWIDEMSVEGALDPLLDRKAKRDYLSKLSSLQEELENAECCHDAGRVDALRRQIEVIRRELAKAIGLDGKDRPIRDPVERIRQKVRKNLCAALEAVGGANALLGWHLRTHIKTGRICRYVPNPTQFIRWDVSLPERRLGKGV